MKRLLLSAFLTSLIFGQLPTHLLTTPHFPIVKSALIPGWGEVSMQYGDRADGFLLREGLLWLVYMGAASASNWYESDMTAYAKMHAGVNMSGKGDQFSVDIGNYDSFEEFNQSKYWQRQIDLVYPEGKGYEWNWDSSKNRAHFDDLRIKSSTANKTATFVVGSLVLHRVISVMDVIYLKRKAKRLGLTSSLIPQAGGGWQFGVNLNF